MKRAALLLLVFAMLAGLSSGCDNAGAQEIPYLAPEVAVETVGEEIVLNWDAIEDPRLEGYKVVVSRVNPNPKFPDDGYLYWITDSSVTSAIIDKADPYHNGDFDYLQPGEKYYFSVTAVYQEKIVPGNALRIVFPKEEDEEPLPAPLVSAEPQGEAVAISWQEIEASELQGYKVVISKDNPNPAYPEDGYLHYITDITQTTVTIDNKTAYNDGDFGEFLIPEEEYYFSITAVYTDSLSAGNAVLVRFPAKETAPPPPPPKEEKDSLAPVVTGKVSQDKITLNWQAINAKNLQGYKVVISKGNSKPKYPDDGYIYWITDRKKTTAVINNSTAYKGKSDFGEFLAPGEKYYFSVTAVYDNKTVEGNALRLKAPEGMKVVDGAYTAPKVSYEMKDDRIRLKWNPIDDPRLQGYKVVISKNNPNPAYPEDGYLFWIKDTSQDRVDIDNSTRYNGKSDFGLFLVPGEKYYFSVTAVYDNKKVASNALHLKAPDGIYVAPKVSHKIEEGKILLKWDPIDDPRLQRYAVVISKSNPNPAYLKDGYLYEIEDTTQGSKAIDISDQYTGKNDFDDFLVPGEKYYFSVTAVYENKKVADNSLRLIVPQDISTE